MRKHLRKLTREGKPIPATLDMSAGIALLPLTDTSETTTASITSVTSVDSDLIRFTTHTTTTTTTTSTDSNTVTLPITKGPVRKAANLAELRRYFKAAEEAANEVIAEQIQLKHTLTKQTVADTDTVHLAQHTSTTNELDYQCSLMVELVEASTRSVYSPTRVLALQKANSNTLFRDKLQIKLHANNITNNNNSSNLQHSSVPVPANPTSSSKPLNYENMNDSTSRKRTHTTMETEGSGVSVAV